VNAQQLAGILKASEVEAASASPHPPLFCASAIRAALSSALGPDCLLRCDDKRAAKHSLPNGERDLRFVVAAGTHRAAVMRAMELHIDELVGCTGGMERIRTTPLPVVYVSHHGTFLLVFLLLLPIVHCLHWSWGTLPVVGLVSFAMLGVEGAATECESPFGDRVNHLAMDAYAALAVANVHEVLRAAVIHAQAPWAIPRLSKEES